MEVQIERKIEEKIGEKHEQEERANNIVFFNLKESQSGDIKAARQEDLQKATEVLRTIVDIDEEEIEEPVRLGKKGERPRCLRMKIKNLEKKKEIINKAKKINRKETPQSERIYINQDLTPAQREEERNLRKELKDRKAAGEKNLFIRNNKILIWKEEAERTLSEERNQK